MISEKPEEKRKEGSKEASKETAQMILPSELRMIGIYGEIEEASALHAIGFLIDYSETRLLMRKDEEDPESELILLFCFNKLSNASVISNSFRHEGFKLSIMSKIKGVSK